MIKKICAYCMGIILCTNLLAQNTQRTGTILASDGTPVIGAGVFVSGTKTGTITDGNGYFSIDCPSNGSLTISALGLDDKTIKVGNQTSFEVTLSNSSLELEEVVFIGYGSVKRKDLTGSVSSISSKEFASVPVSNIAQALSGRIAGMEVTTVSGAPDAQISIRVRGGTSITQDNSPLYVIDGFPTKEGLIGIEPSDIESIDVMKDASATAIYGSAGANGVIIITTKSAKTSGRVSVNYDMYIGAKSITKQLSVLDARDYVKMDYERSLNNGSDMASFATHYGMFADIENNYAVGSGINWQNEAFGRTPLTQMHKIGINGATDKTNYALSYSFNDDGGIMYNSGLKRHVFRSKFLVRATDKLKVGANVYYTNQETTGIGSLEQGGRFSKLRNIIQYRPTGGLLYTDEEFMNAEEDPKLAEDSGNVLQNPIVNTYAEDIKKINKILTADASLEYRIFKYLNYRGTVGIRQRHFENDKFYTAKSVQAKRSGGPYGSISHNWYNTFSFSNTLTYEQSFKGMHDLQVMLGQEWIQNQMKNQSFSNNNFPTNNFGVDDMSLGSTPGIPTSGRSMSKQLSFFGRVNYTLMDKYLFTATLRTDGASQFGKNHKWGVFPAGSFAWRASEEDFIKDWNCFSNLKFRLSYGATGNNNIDNYLSLSLFSSGTAVNNNSPVASYYGANIANPDLKWETNVTANFGIDMGFLQNRLLFTLDMYDVQTKDLLLSSLIPYSSGYASVMRNIGATQNRGIEFSLTSHNIKRKNFEWTTSFNISFNKNKVKALAGTDSYTLASNWNGDFKDDDYIVAVGQSLGQMYGYLSDGIYTVDDFNYDPATEKWSLKEGVAYNQDELSALKPGYKKYKNISNEDRDEGDTNEYITTKDRTVIGNANPIFYGGLNNTFTFYGVDLSIYMNYSYGNDIYNANKMMFSQMSTQNNNILSSAYKDRFVTIDATGNSIMNNPEALAAANKGVRKPSIAGSASLRLSDEFIEDGSYLRINNITLGYTFPKKLLSKAHIQNLRAYFSVYNVCTFTGYSGYDPEVSVQLENGSLTPGVDWGAYPRAKSFVFGLNLAF